MSLEVNSNDASKHRCEICYAESDGLHFAVYSCRACAAFFRRTVSLNKRYICREQGQCNIDQAIRSICKFCRLEKCLKLGMRKSGVQEKRVKIGKRKCKQYASSEQENGTSHNRSDSPTFSTNPVNVSQQNGLQLIAPILSKVVTQYECMKRLRRIVHDKEFLTKESNPPKLVTTLEAMEMEARDIRLVGDFITKSFTQFAGLDPGQKEILFKNFFLSFALLETSFDTAKIGRNDIAILPSGDYLDLSNLSFEVDGNRADFFGRSVGVYQSNIIGMMEKHKFDTVEFLALITILLFDIGVIGQSQECASICETMREAVLNELSQYYTTILNIENQSTRTAHLTLLAYHAQRVCKRVKEDFEVGKLFNFNAINDRLYDIICESSSNEV